MTNKLFEWLKKDTNQKVEFLLWLIGMKKKQ